MECQFCGVWRPADRETGYDGDTICPDCAARVCASCYARLCDDDDTTGLCPACLEERDDARRADQMDRHLEDARR